MELSKDGLIGWSAPDCPFRIEYAPQVLEEIRLAVVDAFFALPRGGAEIGGILLGRHRKGVVAVTSHRHLDCEHFFGPSFTLSPRDEAKLRELMVTAAGEGGQAVGWYHSHTRSGIFLSNEDLDIYRRYFPEPWQVALVLKPHSYDPTRAGFFFRDAKGTIRSESSAAEFALEALPQQALLPGISPGTEALAYSAELEMEPAPRAPLAPSIALQAAAPPEVEAFEEPAEEQPAEVEESHEVSAAESVESNGELAIPRFLQEEPETRRSWRWLRLLLSVGVGMAIGAVAFNTRQMWLPRLEAAHIASALPSWAYSAKPPSLGLNLLDSNGQLQIRWNAAAPAMANATSAVLDIVDGSALPHSVTLDQAHLQSGSFTYARESGEVDVAITVERPGGAPLKEATSFWGKPPAAASAAGDDTENRQQRDDSAVERARLEAELKAETERSKKLERSLAEARGQMKGQQRKRLETQDTGR